MSVFFILIALGAICISFSPYEQPWLVPVVIVLLTVFALMLTIVLAELFKISMNHSKLALIYFVAGIFFALHTIRQLTLADVMLVSGCVVIVSFYLKGR